MNLYQNKYRIPTARATWHDYSGGAYFITICTAGRMHYFGEIENGEMQLFAIGKIASDHFSNVSIHYPYAEIPLFVVMPNHIHAIVIIDGNDGNYRNAINRVSTATETTTVISRNPMIYKSLGTVIRGVKARISRMAHLNGIPFGWQARFYDHIIRNQDEMNRIATYTYHNVSQWDLDELNKAE